MDRIIFHVDLDCFFAAVEILDHPEYKGFPLITGADPKKGKGRGVVTTCSYEAREFGLHSGMPISKAYHLCPQGIYVKSNRSRVREISLQVMNILDKYSPVFQQVGSDEAYLDMSEIAIDMNHAYEIAKKIKDEVQLEVGITCSIGVAFTKSLAKIGSDCNKPNGITIINPENYKSILSPLKITRIPGIGKKSKIYYEKHGFQLIGDFLKIPKHKMIAKFGDRGRWIYNLINGLENRKVHDSNYINHRKSISKERTFYEDTDNYQEIISKITDLNDKIHKILKKKGKIKKDIKFVAFGGDGGTYDIGLQSLSGALERGHNFLYVAYDNQGYMNTGGQRSGASPYGANMETTPASRYDIGNETDRKDLMQIVNGHHIKYLAQANVAFVEDLAMKAKKALETEGPTFLLVLQPCTNVWKFPTSDYVKIGKLATETNFWPLYEISAQGGSALGGENGKYKINYIPKKRQPIEDFLKTQKRFKHLFSPEHKKVIPEIQKMVDRKWEELKKVASDKR